MLLLFPKKNHVIAMVEKKFELSLKLYLLFNQYVKLYIRYIYKHERDLQIELKN